MARKMGTPALQRRLQSGCRGGDVKAVQRALYHGLAHKGSKATNDRSGKYGPRTVRDVQTFQRAHKIAPSGKVGTNTLIALWQHGDFPAGYMNEGSVQLLYRVTLGRPTKLKRSELKLGAKGPHVKALQRMLKRGLGSDTRNAGNGTYGKGTAEDVNEFRQRCGWGGRNPNVVGQELWDVLWPFADDQARQLARKVTSSPQDQIRQRIRSWGEWYVINRNRITYAQVRPYPKAASLPLRTDCSGSATSILRWAGCPNDPHGRGWDGQGYTGTMQARGTRVPLAASSLRPGDCVFYGNQGGGVSSHVVIVIGPGDRAMTFGSNPPRFVWISSYWRSNLRTDIGARRYF